MKDNIDTQLQNWIEHDIQMAANSRICPATGQDCNIPNPQTAESLKIWVEYIQRCARNNSTEIFSTSDKPRFVKCCNQCGVYADYKQQKTNPQSVTNSKTSLKQHIQTAWQKIHNQIKQITR